MSTWYYAVCDKHKAVSRIIGGRSYPQRWWSNDGGELEDFLQAHADCSPCPQIVNEDDDRCDAYTEVPSLASVEAK